jgi:hypothetical protein
VPDAAEQTMRRRVIAAKHSTYPAAIVQLKTQCQQYLKEKGKAIELKPDCEVIWRE